MAKKIIDRKQKTPKNNGGYIITDTQADQMQLEPVDPAQFEPVDPGEFEPLDCMLWEFPEG